MERTLTISESDLLAALSELMPAEGEGLLRTAEIAEELGCTKRAVNVMLLELKAQGKLIEGRKTYAGALGGRRCSVEAYGLKDAKE